MRKQRPAAPGGGGRSASSKPPRRPRSHFTARTPAAPSPSSPVAQAEQEPAARAASVDCAPYAPLSLESPRVAANDAQQRAMYHLQHGRQVIPKRNDSMAVRAVAEMVAAMKKVEVGVLDAERTAASERDLRKQTEARAAAAEARASDAEAERDRLRQQLEDWRTKALQHEQQAKERIESFDAAVKDRVAMEKQLSEVSAALAECRATQNGLEAELEMTRQQLQDAAAFAGWGQTPDRAALRWGSSEWWSCGGRVGVVGAAAHGPRFAAPSGGAEMTSPRAPPQSIAVTAAPMPQSSFTRGADSSVVSSATAMALAAELSAAARERERLARDLGVVFDPR